MIYSPTDLETLNSPPDSPAAPLSPLAASAPYPGTPLHRGSTGPHVVLMQQRLNAISNAFYPIIGTVKADGLYGSATETTVLRYQTVKNLTVDGVIGKNTWDAIVTDSTSIPSATSDAYPGTPLRQGSTGPNVAKMQQYLNDNATLYTAINTETVDSVFGSNMAAAVRRFQKQFGLSADEVIGEQTWNRIVEARQKLLAAAPLPVLTPYPGNPVSQGSSGDSVRFIQSYLNRVGSKTGAWQPVTIDGTFGSGTKQMVMKFQTQYALKPDGIVGSATWAKMTEQFNAYRTA